VAVVMASLKIESKEAKRLLRRQHSDLYLLTATKKDGRTTTRIVYRTLEKLPFSKNPNGGKMAEGYKLYIDFCKDEANVARTAVSFKNATVSTITINLQPYLVIAALVVLGIAIAANWSLIVQTLKTVFYFSVFLLVAIIWGATPETK